MFLNCFAKITTNQKKKKKIPQPPHTRLLESCSGPERKRKDAREDKREQNKTHPGQKKGEGRQSAPKEEFGSGINVHP